MRIAFYAPLKAPTHGVASGDRRVARLLMQALQEAGHVVELVSEFRSFDGAGDPQRQQALQREGGAIARDLIARWLDARASLRPELWFTYHLYYKAPDWLGPVVSRALAIPYVIAEASNAPKRAGGAWASGHAAVQEAIAQADLLVCPTQHDVAGLRPLAGAGCRILRLPPFLDAASYQRAARKRGLYRLRLQQRHDLPPEQPWLIVAAMMRAGDKLESYRVLAQTLALLRDLQWQLLVAGDGAVRAEIQALLDEAAPGRVRLLGACDARTMAALYAASDLCIWPAVNEAYGMAMLEAQAAGTPVVSSGLRGVPDVVCDGRTGLLAPQAEPQALADCARALLSDPARRLAMACAASAFVGNERSVPHAAQALRAALHELGARRVPAPPLVGEG